MDSISTRIDNIVESVPFETVNFEEQYRVLLEKLISKSSSEKIPDAINMIMGECKEKIYPEKAGYYKSIRMCKNGDLLNWEFLYLNKIDDINPYILYLEEKKWKDWQEMLEYIVTRFPLFYKSFLKSRVLNPSIVRNGDSRYFPMSSIFSYIDMDFGYFINKMKLEKLICTDTAIYEAFLETPSDHYSNYDKFLMYLSSLEGFYELLMTNRYRILKFILRQKFELARRVLMRTNIKHLKESFSIDNPELVDLLEVIFDLEVRIDGYKNQKTDSEFLLELLLSKEIIDVAVVFIVPQIKDLFIRSKNLHKFLPRDHDKISRERIVAFDYAFGRYLVEIGSGPSLLRAGILSVEEFRENFENEVKVLAKEGDMTSMRSLLYFIGFNKYDTNGLDELSYKIKGISCKKDDLKLLLEVVKQLIILYDDE